MSAAIRKRTMSNERLTIFITYTKYSDEEKKNENNNNNRGISTIHTFPRIKDFNTVVTSSGREHCAVVIGENF